MGTFGIKTKKQKTKQNKKKRKKRLRPYSSFVFVLFCLFFPQVVVVAGFTPVEEVERISMAPRETAEKVVRDFFREARVGDHCITMLLVGLVEEVELWEWGRGEEEEEEEGTLGEAVEMVIVIPVGVGVALTTMETTRTMRVVMVRLVMVR